MNRKFLFVIILFVAYSFSYSITASARASTDLRLNGSASLNLRNIGPRCPGFENQIQTQVYLADVYFGLNGKVNNKIPFWLEFQIPTSAQGQVKLHRLSTQFTYKRKLNLELGKFLVPFGRYNKLYRPEQFLSLTRPLLYSSPDSLDLVVRLNSPRPPFSSGYSDVGARLSYYPESQSPFKLEEITLYMVNGFGEANNRLRTFQNTNNLHVQGEPIEGVNIDFGHLNNNLADNNNNKTGGARIVFGLGDKAQFGISGMYGKYDLEEAIIGQEYFVAGADFAFQYNDLSFTGEYVYSETDFRHAKADSDGSIDFSPDPLLLRLDILPSKMEINQGFFIQSVFPILRKPPLGKKLLGILAFSRLERRGPKLVFSKNSNPATNMPITAFPALNERITTSINKYTTGINLKVTDNVIFKAEYSYWDINVPPLVYKYLNPSRTHILHQKDVYQTGFSWVLYF